MAVSASSTGPCAGQYSGSSPNHTFILPLPRARASPEPPAPSRVPLHMRSLPVVFALLGSPSVFAQPIEPHPFLPLPAPSILHRPIRSGKPVPDTYFVTDTIVVTITGHPVGGVCPFGLENQLSVYCDISLKQYAEVLPAAGAIHSAVRISPERMAELTSARWVDVCI